MDASLTEDDLAAVVDAAITSMVEHYGLSPEQEAKLRAVDVSIADLQGMVIGRTDENNIIVDANAAGNGWFVDLTPLADEEYAADVDGILRAIPTSAANDRMDLLSVLRHEFGHTLGFTHLPYADPNDLMTDVLETGLRLSLSINDTLGAQSASPTQYNADAVSFGGAADTGLATSDITYETPGFVFDDTVGRFVGAEEARLLRFAKSLTSDGEAGSEAERLGELLSDHVTAKTPEVSTETGDSDQIAGGVIDWQNTSSLLGRLSSVFKVFE